MHKPMMADVCAGCANTSDMCVSDLPAALGQRDELFNHFQDKLVRHPLREVLRAALAGLRPISAVLARQLAFG